ncbi:MAG TPA: hypothetical protein VGD79_00985 [Thermoanaerobaculia bacterium]|jgi:hypothetical protein
MNQTDKTEREIDDLVISQADDPSAWEEEASVKPRRWKVNPSRLELAAKFFVLSALHRLGAEATLALGEREDVDIAIITEAGRATTVDVKTLTGGCRWRVEDIHGRMNHYVVFVCFTSEILNPHVSPEVFVFPSQTLQDALSRQHSTEIRVDDLGAELKAREAWHQLVAP